MNKPILYRKRFLPMETVLLKDDIVLYRDDEMILTKWNVFRPKLAFSQGISCYFLKRGYKVSKFMNNAGELVYYYCDIIQTSYDAQTDTYIFTDLLADVIIEPSGFVKVVDLAEISDALDNGDITQDMVKICLRQLESLLEVIYAGKLCELTKYLEIEES